MLVSVGLSNTDHFVQLVLKTNTLLHLLHNQCINAIIFRIDISPQRAFQYGDGQEGSSAECTFFTLPYGQRRFSTMRILPYDGLTIVKTYILTLVQQSGLQQASFGISPTHLHLKITLQSFILLKSNQKQTPTIKERLQTYCKKPIYHSSFTVPW